ncbi:2OG-Fe(II) oxygenase [Microbulbifer sp. ALW1]|uniref:prolyl hydroxylase family protein n=1 Tax=Microbulbifer sp. (strain ALW1) TaxID=1516059 RepID=UPI0013576256|nr:2OG-Fe(II) oxygenase [Microbulbifer sp. ALW1]
MAITQFDVSWRDWIQTNINRGCETAELYRILIGHDFCPDLVARTLNYWPVNPRLASANAAQRADRSYTSTATEIEASGAQPLGALPINTGGRLQLFLWENFLTADECRQIIDLVRPHLRPSTTTNAMDQYRDFRTSCTCDLGLMESPLAQELDRRICHSLGINPAYSESIQAQWYRQGQQFKPHTDYFEPGSEEYQRFASERGQRTWTFMIYLNDDCDGGETRFTRLQKSFVPQAGCALIWNSLNTDGSPNPDSIHWGMPVVRGEKVIITKWFRARGQGAQLIRR